MYGRWGGWGFDRGSPLSVLEQVKSGTMDLRLASLLWLIMEQRASVLVAAGPSLAGKTTTLNVMMDFLRPEVKQIELQGDAEDFRFLKSAEPSGSYLVAAEFSNHGMYVWGDVAIRAFGLIAQGYAMGGTIHALTARDVVEVLHRYLGLQVVAISQIDAIVTLSVTGNRIHGAEPVRRIAAVTLVMPHEKGIALEEIASLNYDGNTFDTAGEEDLQAALSTKFGIEERRVILEMREREQFLGKLLEEGTLSRDAVREAIIEFYRARPAAS